MTAFEVLQAMARARGAVDTFEAEAAAHGCAPELEELKANVTACTDRMTDLLNSARDLPSKARARSDATLQALGALQEEAEVEHGADGWLHSLGEQLDATGQESLAEKLGEARCGLRDFLAPLVAPDGSVSVAALTKAVKER